MKIGKVTRDHIQALINQLYKKQKLSYSSVKKVYVALNSCFKHALMADVVAKNAYLGFVLPAQSEGTKQVTPLSTADVEKLKAELLRTNVDGKPVCSYGQAYLLILNTGLRMGEALSLCWDDVDFENKTVSF